MVLHNVSVLQCKVESSQSLALPLGYNLIIQDPVTCT